MWKMGPNDGQAIVWALGTFFFFSNCSYSITTNYLFYTDTSITYEDRARNGWRYGKQAQTMARLLFGPQVRFFFILFVCILLLTTFFFFFTDTSITYEDRARNGQQRGEWSLQRQGQEWVATWKTGPNDGQAVVWALGKFFFFCLFVFYYY